ncbi:MAG: DUF1850 domain-containing protein [Armatimonadota bacterium]|nr:DUF1850 domain-containing protein [Armatimonadota bacterium]
MLFVDRSALVVRVADGRSGRTLWQHRVRAGASFELRYRHSVERTPIVEVFRAEPDGMWFVEMRFVSQGAGLPADGYEREGDHFILRRPRRVGVLPLLVSSASGHRLRVGHEDVDLVALAGDGQGVILAVARTVVLTLPGRR